jgi:hypothetical protein
MKHYPPRISAYDFGVWRQDDPHASRFGIRFEFGEFLEINCDWPGIDKNWFANIESLDKDTHGVLVWRRP